MKSALVVRVGGRLEGVWVTDSNTASVRAGMWYAAEDGYGGDRREMHDTFLAHGYYEYVNADKVTVTLEFTDANTWEETGSEEERGKHR